MVKRCKYCYYFQYEDYIGFCTFWERNVERTDYCEEFESVKNKVRCEHGR